MRILVTGANGFIGKHLISALIKRRDLTPIAGLRSKSTLSTLNIEHLIMGDLSSDTHTYDLGMNEFTCVVHAAGRAHRLREKGNKSLAQHRLHNVAATARLAIKSANSGVQRFLFISSLGVHGKSSHRPLRASDVPHPVKDYAKSKLEAELTLAEIGRKTGMEIVVIRPPMVYGYNAPGNFGRLIKLVCSPYPLPLGKIQNLRSFVALDNLVDLITLCIVHPRAANQTFLVSDNHDLSTSEFIERLRLAAREKPRLIPCPKYIIRSSLATIGKRSIADSLVESLQVDISHTKKVLNWNPPISVDQGIYSCFNRPSNSFIPLKKK